MRTFKRWLLGICIVGFAVLILSLAHLGQPTPPLQVSPSTTVITEPLTDDNLPDYAAYHLNQLRGDITPAENAALPLLQALWPGEIRPRSREALCAELGMEIPDRQGLKEKGFWPGSAASVVRDIMVHQPWTAEEFPLVAEWIEAQHDTFRLLHEAAGKPKFYFPSPTLLLEPKSPFLAMEVPHLPLLQTGVEALAVRSMYALGRGDIEAAWEDARAIYRLSELVPHDTTVSAVFTIAYDNVAHQVTLRILESPQLSTSLAEEVCAYLAERRPRFSAQRALELERLSLASTLVYYSSQPGSRLDELLASRFPSEEVGAALATVPMDWNVVLRRSNAWYDQAVQAVSDADLSGRTHRIREIEREIERARPTTTDIALGVISREMRSRQMADLMMRQWLLSTLSTVALHEFRERASLGLMQVATHLAVYRAAHGAYPKSLDVVENAGELLPRDVGGRPFQYEKTESGYLLYSYGPNQVDDRGSNRMDQVLEGCVLYRGGYAKQYPFEGHYARFATSEAATRELLGYPPGTELHALMPETADDVAIRLPQPLRVLISGDDAAELPQ